MTRDVAVAFELKTQPAASGANAVDNKPQRTQSSAMTSHDLAPKPTGTLLMNTRARAKLRRTDPYEVREAYEWAR